MKVGHSMDEGKEGRKEGRDGGRPPNDCVFKATLCQIIDYDVKYALVYQVGVYSTILGRKEETDFVLEENQIRL